MLFFGHGLVLFTLDGVILFKFSDRHLVSMASSILLELSSILLEWSVSFDYALFGVNILCILWCSGRNFGHKFLWKMDIWYFANVVLVEVVCQ